MIRKFLLPALAVAMLGGCVTSGYEYRGGNGDYYYGQPQVEYRDYGSPYGGFGYGYPGGWSGSFGYGYGDPYGYYGGYGGYYDPWNYYTPYRRPRHRGDDHHGDHGQGTTGVPTPVPTTVPTTVPGGNDGHRPPPWRDFVRVPAPGTRPGTQPRLDGALPTARPPMPRMGDPQIVTREVRRDPERAQDRREAGGMQIRREPDRGLRRTDEP